MRRSPGRIFHLSLVVLGLLTAWWVSVPGWSVRVYFAAVPLWLLALTTWAVRGIVYLFLGSRSSPEGEARRLFLVWSKAPAIAGLTLAAVISDLPFELRFRLSRASFEADASQWIRSAERVEGKTVPARLGLYLAHRNVESDAIYCKIDGAGGLFGWGGFVYSPRHVPVQSVRDLGGGWYVWLDST